MAVTRSMTRYLMPRRYRRFRNAAWRVIGKSVYYGLILQLGLVQAKALMCRLCRTYLQNMTARDFWILFAAMILLFSFINCMLMNLAGNLFRREKSAMASKKQFSKYNGKWEQNTPKLTRSGSVYGYM